MCPHHQSTTESTPTRTTRRSSSRHRIPPHQSPTHPTSTTESDPNVFDADELIVNAAWFAFVLTFTVCSAGTDTALYVSPTFVAVTPRMCPHHRSTTESTPTPNTAVPAVDTDTTPHQSDPPDVDNARSDPYVLDADEEIDSAAWFQPSY